MCWCFVTDPYVYKVLEGNDGNGMIQRISKAILKNCKYLVDQYSILVDKQTGINSVIATHRSRYTRFCTILDLNCLILVYS